ncbi:MAG TPA: adenylate/guanylate cyclase domain-containing protein [Casimicrobiaceae bacterium]
MNAQGSLPRYDHPIIHWLLRDGRRTTDSTSFLNAFAEQLLASGIEIGRVVTGVPILHPQVFAFSGIWEAGKGASERRYLADASTLSRLQRSPIKTVYEGRGPVRCDLTAPASEGEYGIYTDLRRESFTDYFAIGVPFSDGSTKALVLATKRPGGFTADEIAAFTAMAPAVAINLEIQALRRTAQTLLETYVGRQAGKRVLDGAIKRGMGETIPAVIWLCDLRGFSTLSEELPREALIDLLNGYFGTMCQAIEQHQGEVLKFIGDALLAIFPISGEGAAPACHQALAAARAATAAIAALNAERIGRNEPAILYGIALHVGDVIYGNIGGENRLDFTVIGPAVNLAARIERLCRELGRALLLSEAFVSAARVAVEPMGRFPLKGMAAPQTVSAPLE